LIHCKDIDGVTHIGVFDEECLPPPNNRPNHLCQSLIKKHHHKMKNGVFIYGDPSGRAKTAFSGDDNTYKVIKEELSRYLNNSSERIDKKHPPVTKSVDFVNNIMDKVYPNIRLWVHPRCKELIADFMFLRQDKNGGKKIEHDKEGFELYGHTSDALRYFLISLFENEFKKHFLI